MLVKQLITDLLSFYLNVSHSLAALSRIVREAGDNFLVQRLQISGAVSSSSVAAIFPVVSHIQCPPLPFGRICLVVLVMRKGGRAVEVVPGI